MRSKKSVELIEHHAGSNADAPVFQIEICDLAVMPREIDDQAIRFCQRVGVIGLKILASSSATKAASKMAA